MMVFESISNSLFELSQYLFDPSQRIFGLYLAGAVLLAVPVYLIQHQFSFVRFFKFLFPRKIWLSKSAQQDYCLLVLNKLIRGVLLAPAIIAIMPIALFVVDSFEVFFGEIAPISKTPWIVMLCFTLILFVLDDLSRFLLHWILHSVPFLWEFHKVHHSAKVLTPFTIYRSHPVENYLFACRLSISQGIAIGVGFYLFSTGLSVIEIAGANIFVFAFNFMGSNLRHSHIWLSWGAWFERWFISPAQHQIHHSDNPKHFDRNLGSALAVWDRIAGTLVLAKDVDRIKFGIGRDFSDHDTLLGIYWLPFRASWIKMINKFNQGD